MRKSIFAIMIIVLAFAGCGGSADETTPEEAVEIGRQIPVKNSTAVSKPVVSEQSYKDVPIKLKLGAPGQALEITVSNPTDSVASPVYISINSEAQESGERIAPASVQPADAREDEFSEAFAPATVLKLESLGGGESRTVTLEFNQKACVAAGTVSTDITAHENLDFKSNC